MMKLGFSNRLYRLLLVVAIGLAIGLLQTAPTYAQCNTDGAPGGAGTDPCPAGDNANNTFDIDGTVTGTVTTGDGNDVINMTGTSTIDTTGGLGSGVQNTNGDVNVNGGTIDSGSVGIEDFGGGNVTNSAAINSNNFTGIDEQGAGSVNNSGNIDSAAGTGISENDAGDLVNSGNVSTTGGAAHGLSESGDGSINNSGNVSVTGANAAAIVESGGTGGITNSGTAISDNAVALQVDGLPFTDEDDLVINTATGIARGGSHGIFGLNGNDTVNNAGEVTGGNANFDAGIQTGNGNDSITNAGTGTVTGHRGINVQGGNDFVDGQGTITGTTADGIGVDLGDGNNTFQTGGNSSISAGGIGISGGLGNDLITITGSATVSATNNSAIEAGGGHNTINAVGASPIVINGEGFGAIFSREGNDSITVGNASVSSGNDPINSGAGNDTIIIQGNTTLNHGPGDDVDAGTGNDSVLFDRTAGAIFGPVLNGGDGTDVLNVVNTGEAFTATGTPAAGNMTIGGEAYSWVNFEQLLGLLAFLDVPPEQAQAIVAAVGGTLENQETCSNGIVKVLRLPDGTQEVYSGFNFDANGVLVASFAPNSFTAGHFITNMTVGSPVNGWTVRLESNGNYSVLDALGNLVNGGCRYLA